MNQAEFINEIAQQHDNAGVSKATIKWVLDSQAKVAQAALDSGDEVTLTGLGKLTVKAKAARPAATPRPARKSRSRPRPSRISARPRR